MKLPSQFSALVTGGGSGLGRELCHQLAQRGGRILIADLELAKAEETAEQILAQGAQAVALACDVAEWEQVQAMASRAKELVGDVDVIVNNAGVAVGGSFCEVSMEDWRWAMDVNLWGVIHGCRAFIPPMRARRRGWVLNVASAAGFVSLAKFAPYNVSKAGVISLSETLRAELEPEGIDVTVVCPTFFQTNIVEAGRGDDDHIRDLIRTRMAESKVQAEDVARHGLRALEKGELHAVAMRDGKLAWLAKRAFPGSFHRMVGKARDIYERTRG